MSLEHKERAELQIQTWASPYTQFSRHPQVRCSFTLLDYRSLPLAPPSVSPTKSVLQAAGRFTPLKQSSNHLSLIKSLLWFSPTVSCTLAFQPSPSQGLNSCSPSVLFRLPDLSPGFSGVPSLPAPFPHIFTKCILGSDLCGQGRCVIYL